MAHSSSGLGHRPLKAEITGSNPVCAIPIICSHPYLGSSDATGCLNRMCHGQRDAHVQQPYSNAHDIPPHVELIRERIESRVCARFRTCGLRFNFANLSAIRSLLVQGEAEQVLLDAMLDLFKDFSSPQKVGSRNIKLGRGTK